ncbi:MAG: hypothetical protein R6U96_13305 [Promethearchaeia archaeon]
MISILLLASFTPIFIILIGILLLLNLDERENRNSLCTLLLGISLFLNTVLLVVYSLLDLNERSFNLNFDAGTLFIIEMILLLGLLTVVFSKREMVNIVNEKQLNSFILLIILSLIGTVLTANILISITCFLLTLFFIGVFFYFGQFTKEFELLRWYFLSVGLSAVLLFFASFLLLLEVNTLIVTEIVFIEISPVSNFFITALFVFGFGIPCGLFPFLIFHLRNYFQDSSYSSLIIYFNFLSTTIFLILRVLNIFSLSYLPNGILILIISSIGLIVSLVYVVTELFTSLDGNTFSIKKIFGYSLCSDFNIALLFISYITILKSMNGYSLYLNILLFLFFSLIALKSLLVFSFFPIMVETFDDNFKLLGSLKEKYPRFSYLFPIIGLIFALPITFLFLNNVMTVFSQKLIISNSLYSFIAFMMVGFYIFYLLIHLILISILFVQIFYGNRPRYIERESPIQIRLEHYRPSLLIFLIIGLIITLGILEVVGVQKNIFYQTFKIFFLNIN